MIKECPYCHKKFESPYSQTKFCEKCRPQAYEDIYRKNYLKAKAEGRVTKTSPEKNHYYYLKRKERFAIDPEYKALYQAKRKATYDKIKSDPEKWEKFKQKQREYIRERRATDPEYRKRCNERSRDWRRRRYGERNFQERNCIICGKSFSTYDSRKIMCGDPECRRKRKIQTTLQGQRRLTIFGRKNLKCQICGNPLPPQKSKYCSRECYLSSMKRRRNEKGI